MNRPDFLGLSTQEPFRVVSFPASQSLHASTASGGPDAISTGISRLNEAVCPPSADDIPGVGSDKKTKGLLCGHVTEVFGPPGVGKTSLALSLASNVLTRGDGGKVVWIADTGPPIPERRLREMLLKSAETKTSQKPPEDLESNLVYFQAPTLPHLLALLLHPPKGFPPDETKLVVVDSVSALFPSYFPNPSEFRARLAQAKITDKSQVQWLVNRKWNVMSELANHLLRLATTRSLAILVINQTHTRIKGLPRATLCPVLAGATWESSIYTRIVLYRDFSTSHDGESRSDVRFAEVMKRAGKILPVRLDENIVPFTIKSDRLQGFDEVASPGEIAPKEVEETSFSQRKRKVDEIADSQDEDDSDGEFGWTEGDNASLLEGGEE
ncbi:hypothetical protein FE257_004683 [Aspergillus nanangensis]|uniref:DNA repair protein RAD51 homolog 3 n=1 Tax=Aspergillus nanangensis TaxID=2582783 RepID=A0AAD4CYG6_ASPNN|nr:hypothetical protein FE257_004683 [Aspergillus nanangensis]